MADNLIFPIQFDLQKAVETAGQEWDKTYAKKLETHLSKRPVNIKLDFENLNDVKTRLAQLKIEPITPETKSSIKELAKELRQLAKALEQVQKYSVARVTASPDAVRASKIALNEEKARSQAALTAQRAARAEANLAQARLRNAKAANVGAAATRDANNAYNEQSGYLQRLLQRMVAYWSVQQVSSFLTNVRQVTAEFELQRVSLGAIIQDQNRANQLFSEIKSFALKSPVSILDLTKYTKQLAAYKIGVDELFETTKKLTDVSVGLGVSMDRVVLAYGQTRATGYLRASEIRQFTEMGVPIVEELAQKLSKMNGELVTAADVMDLVSKRGISFELVKDVFDDMTSAGGMFYQMQEKQGNTLFGLWAKLGDAASVMYDEIGNTESVNEGMKNAIQLLTDLMKNWREVGRAIGVAGIGFAAMWGIKKIKGWQQGIETAQAAARQKAIVAEMEYAKAVNAYNTARLSGNYADTQSTRIRQAQALATLKAARAEMVAANATTLWSEAWNNLKAAFLGNWVTLLLAIIAAIGAHIYNSIEKANRLKNALNDIRSETFIEQSRSVTNFESLANAAISAANGSKQQRDALEELKRTYRDIIPEQNLTIEKLREMKGNYEALTSAIEENIRQQQLQKGQSKIEEEYGQKILEAERIVRHQLTSGVLVAGANIDERQANRIIDNIKRMVKEGVAGADALRRAYEMENIATAVGTDWEKFADRLGVVREGAGGLAGVLTTLDQETKKWQDSMQPAYAELGKLADQMVYADKKISEHNFVAAPNTFEFDIEQAKVTINAYVEAFKNALAIAGADIDISKYITLNANGIPQVDWRGIDEVLLTLNNKLQVPLQDMSAKIQEKYENFVPKDPVVKSVRNKFEELANSMGLINKVRTNMMGATENLEDYRKKINDTAKDYATQVENLTKVLAMTPAITVAYKEIADKLQNAKDLEEFFSKMAEILGKSSSGGSTRTSDPRLQNLKEEISLVQKLYNEYKQLEKQEGATKAAADMRRMAGDTLDMFKSKYNIDLPTDAKDLTAALEVLYKKMAALPKKVFPSLDKDLKELRWTIEKVDIDESQKNIEAELKRLSDRISRTKTAKEFYEKILRLTRNEDLAFRATFSVFGQDKLDTFSDEVEQLKQNFGEIDITAAINLNTKQIDYKALREIWDADKALPDNLRKIPQAYDSAIKSILDAGDKLSEKQFERWGKDLERARDYADKRIELAEYTATQIAEIEAKRDSLKPDSEGYEQQRAMYDEMIRGYREREKNESAKLDYEQIKEQIGMFDDLGVRIGTAFENILNGLREYTQSPDFARLGLEAQKNVYQQIAKIEDRMAEGFQGIGVGSVSEYVRQYSTAASEYLTAQNNLREATLKAIEADKEWERVKNGNDEAAKSAALAEKTLADSRVRTAAASVNAAGANLQRAQEGAARASAKFDSNLQKVESSLKSLNNGALKALWDLIGDKGKRSVGEFLSGSRKILSALDKLTKALADSGSDMGQLSTTIATNLATALQNINPEDTEAIAKAATESLKTTLSSVISDKGVVDLLANTLSKNIGEIASQALSGVLSTEDAANKVGALIDGVADAASKTGEMWGAIISLVLSLLDEFAENGIGTFLGELLDNVADAVEGILANLLTDSLPKILGGVGNVIKGVGTGLGDLLTFGAFDLTGAKRIKKANKEIKKQEELLEQLEYTYGRLEKAADKTFGSDFVMNQNQQQKILLAQQEAYMKQYEAEKSKGKKADEEKMQEYLDKARDVGDQIADMQGKIAEKMTGTDVASAARDFANAWLEAYASFGSTSDAIKEKFNDLIKNMIVESVMAKAVQVVLQPIFDKMDKMYESGRSMTDVLGYAFSQMEGANEAINGGLLVYARQLESLGINIRDMYSTSDNLKGISRDIATASERDINGLASHMSTVEYYVSTVPGIAADVAAMRAALEGGGLRVPNAEVAPAVDYTSMIDIANQHLQSLPRIEQHVSNIYTLLNRVVVAKGGKFGVNSFYNS